MPMMRNTLIFFLFIVPLIYADWRLVWSDEFNGSTLDTSKWDVEVNCWGGGNLEKQCYVNSPNNIYISDGSLHIRPIAGNYQGKEEGCTLNNENSCTWTQPSTSGRIRTLKSDEGHWKYGKFEIRARMPKGDFLWPALWMLPTDNVYGPWAASGEIDIMEFRGQDRDTISHAIHFGGEWPNNRYYTSGNLKFNNIDFTEDYHVYGLEWTKDNLIWFLDGRETYRESLQRSFGDIYTANGQPFDQRFHLIFNVAVGGNFFDQAIYGPFDISRASTWTQPLSIDYVRVYEWE